MLPHLEASLKVVLQPLLSLRRGLRRHSGLGLQCRGRLGRQRALYRARHSGWAAAWPLLLLGPAWGACGTLHHCSGRWQQAQRALGAAREVGHTLASGQSRCSTGRGDGTCAPTCPRSLPESAAEREDRLAASMRPLAGRPLDSCPTVDRRSHLQPGPAGALHPKQGLPPSPPPKCCCCGRWQRAPLHADGRGQRPSPCHWRSGAAAAARRQRRCKLAAAAERRAAAAAAAARLLEHSTRGSGCTPAGQKQCRPTAMVALQLRVAPSLRALPAQQPRRL